MHHYSESKLFVEINVIMNPETDLHTSHDVGERLQQKIEQHPWVERCFVLCDW